MRGHGAAGAGGGSAAGQAAGKRRWKGQAAAVLALVVFSLLVPLAFLLGLHNRFPSGYLVDDRTQQEGTFANFNNVVHHREQNPSKDDQLTIPNPAKEFTLTFPKNADTGPPSEEMYVGANNNISSPSTLQPKGDTFKATPKDDVTKPKDPITRNNGASEESSSPRTRSGEELGHQNHDKGSNAYEAERSCELEFGSYCIWSRKHREVMKDSLVKRLKDQLFVARGYYPSIAKLQGQESLTRELKLNIQDHERMLSEAVSDPDLPPLVQKKLRKMGETIAKAKSCTVDCSNVERKLRQLLDLTEDEAHFHMKQSAFLYHLGVQTMSKSFHCLSMRLTVEFFKSPLSDMEVSSTHKIDNPGFQHYVIFSRNILALSVTINSTVVNSEESDRMVFHVVTDKENFYSMKHWFARNSYRGAAVHILNFDELKFNLFANLDLAELSMSEEFRVSTQSLSQPSPLQMRTKYISVFGHSHFLLAEIFKNLKKVIVLDDDVVVQKDISFLWNQDLGGKVNGAVEFCEVKLGQLKSYLGSSGYDSNSCAWMSGLNVIDLEKWREYDISGIYHRFLHKLQQENEAQWRAATLPASLLAFHGQIYSLDNTLIQQGLGHDYGIPDVTLQSAAALHYNGNMKPWLDLGIPKYKKYWKKYLTQDERFMEECNVNP
ncbi:putative galacturonosyltransferase 7 isoform X1 [Canna indica]|uniref:Hexosyltransferase n=1 Tax=Canna indica TaxID=4628 RepID=A0AAQ3K8N7_9LILI|nr:putative galacturonosyltransferase 7 isoform X1 [Canna indica]